MAHEIDQTTGRAAVMVAGAPAWHRLGVNVSEAQTSREAITLGGLDFEAEKHPLFTEVAVETAEGTETQRVEVPGSFAVVRSDTRAVLGTVGNWYRPFQNREAFDFMDALVQDDTVKFETCGALKGGRRVWMLARMPNDVRVTGDDIVRPYVLLTNSHDGTSGLRIVPTTVRVVCWNTLSLALRRAGSAEGLTITHTESLERRVSEARRKLGFIVKRMDRFEEESQALAGRSMNQTELTAYFTSLVADRAEKSQQKMLGSFLENFDNDRNRLPGMAGSAWAAYNAVSEWADHTMTVRGEGEAARLDNRVNSIWFGAAHRMKQQAWQQAMTLVS